MTKRLRPYHEAAQYYGARPPYSNELFRALAAKLGWDGTGRLLDVGCGPGVIALQLGDGFADVIGLDPEPAMLEEAARLTPANRPEKFRWVLGRAEEIPKLGLGSFRASTLAQSFHWMDKDLVADVVYDALEGGGSLALIHHHAPAFGSDEFATVGNANPPPHPPIPHDVIDQMLVRWLGHGKPPPDPNREPYADFLARSRFRGSELIILPGRRDLVRTPDEVIDNYLSTAFAAPELFGPRLEGFRAELRAELAHRTLTGFFWEWPGDTEVLLARKSSMA